MSLTMGLVAAALVGTPHCVGMCGGLAVAGGGDAGEQGAWHAGRIGTYGALGAISGALGHALPGAGWASALGVLLLFVFAGALAGLLPEPAVRWPGLARAGAWFASRRGVWARLGFGATTGLLPCGLVYSALAVPVALADPVAGAAAMVVFGLATTPTLVLATVGLRRALNRRPWTRKLLALGVLVSGLAAIGLRGNAASVEGAPACHVSGH